MHPQGEFDFDNPGDETGHVRWLAGRQMAAQALAQSLNLPLEHQVEVWLRGGVRLRGKLRLKDGLLFLDEAHSRHLELVVDHVAFTYAELESCVRLD